jgi:hypothetical protein
MMNNKVILTAAILGTLVSSSAFAAGSNTGYNNVSNGDYGTVFGSNNTTETSATSSLAFGDGNVVKQANSMAFGQGNLSDGENSFVGGDKAKAVGRDAFAFGSSAEALTEYTIAIGSQARTIGYNTLAIGNGATVSGPSSIAIGRTNNVTGENSVAIGANNGTIKGEQAVVVGYNNKMTTADQEQLIFGSNSVTSGQGSIVVGTHGQATAVDALALGNNTIADVQNGVAIGTNSVTESAVGTSNIKDNTTDIRFSNSTYAGSTPDSVVSFGTNGRAGAGGVTSYTRQLQNVAAGRVSSTSTDAINGSQLYDVALEAQKYNTMANGFNTTVVSTDNAYGRKEFKVNVNKDLVDMNSAAFGKNTDSKHTVVNTDGTIVFDGDKNTKYGANGLTIEDRNNLDTASYNINGMTASDANGTVSFTTTNIDAGNNQIHNVKAGTALTDAVNVKQLRDSETNIYNTINSTGDAAVARANHYTDLQAAKVGARAAAMANLHYQDFNADNKWSFAAGYGHYKGQNAGALGVAYQPNENTMISVSSTIGKDAMIGAGVSMKFGKSSKMNANKQVAMAKEIQELRAIVAAQNAKIDALVDHAMGRNEAITDVVFPDVPENHWAYMMVQDLAYKGIVVGYPDNNFSGDRTLTRYEFAVALDRAISAGYMNPELGRAIKEFKPELDSIYANMRFRVDRESGKDGSVNKVERVRVNKDSARDNYGTIVK